MRHLPILWQRLVSEQGTTCPRCHSTGEEVQRAVKTLKLALEPLGIEPELQVTEIDEVTFLKDPLQSNQVLIGGQSYDVIPEDLLVRAGVIAATRMLDPTLSA